jgi:hypothetical protein
MFIYEHKISMEPKIQSKKKQQNIKKCIKIEINDNTHPKSDFLNK